ncbi:hypothetical protein CASFOL_031214 [Castilleja foliolosa]|uniref:RRM domain-containing protein n=1 Tax=Castilleja foliolosa TaxID=1961234 RepID=A0ABD3C437_9LAMI
MKAGTTMAFLNRVGNLVKQNVGKHFSSSSPSLFQAIEPESSPTRIIVRDLAPSIEVSQLEEAFSEHGTVTEAETILYRKSGHFHAHGFVTFATMEAAESAIEAFNGRFCDGLNLSVAFADEEEDGYKKSGVLSLYEKHYWS